jgi:hypothetical protein
VPSGSFFGAVLPGFNLRKIKRGSFVLAVIAGFSIPYNLFGIIKPDDY